jgi:hypothetical protein
LIYPPELKVKETTDTASSASLNASQKANFFYSPGPVACFSDEDDVSGNQNSCYWPLHSESIARCKHHMQEKLVYCLSIKNSKFAEFLPLIYPPELKVKETTDTASSASFLDLYLEFDDSGQLSTKIYDKRDDFNFKIINYFNYESKCQNTLTSHIDEK